MNKPEIKKSMLKSLASSKFLNMAGIDFGKKLYYVASRRPAEEILAAKTEEELLNTLPDAVSCIVIVNTPGDEPRLLMNYEFRYPVGQFLLSPVAGLIDKEDALQPQPILSAAKREIFEESGIVVKDSDRLFMVNPMCFSSPGMTDESNAFACAVVDLPDLSSLNQNGAEGTECFDGFELITKAQARKLIEEGSDKNGMYYSVYTWAMLVYFLTDLWKEN